MLHLEISFAGNAERIEKKSKEKLSSLLNRIEKENIPTLPKREMTISLIFTTDSEIRKLNAMYRKKDAPTDVLSFLLVDIDSPKTESLFGEIYISIPTAKKQAEEYGHSFSAELNTLFVHGILHLLGYDHKTNKEFLQMNAIEKKILKPSKM